MDPDGLEVDGEALTARDSIVAGEDFVDLFAPLLVLLCGDDEAGAPVTVQALAIGEVQSKLLIALPAAAWHRKVARRTVPRGFLTKVVAVETAACLASDRGREVAGQTVRLWIGLCEPAAESALEVTDDEPSVLLGQLPSENSLLPFGEALGELLQAQLVGGTTSAQTANEGPGSSAEAGLTHRIASIERALSQLTAALHPSVEPAVARPNLPVQTEGVKLGARSSGLGSTPAPKASAEAPAGTFPGLDRGVVAAAMAAGVEAQALQEMSRLLSAGPLSRLRSEPPPRPRPENSGPLDESEDEALRQDPLTASKRETAPHALQSESSPAEVLAHAMVKCLDSLQGRASSSKAGPLERALDASGGGSLEGSLGGGRRNAAARRALREALLNSPEEISLLVEALMSEDLSASTPGVGAPAVTSARGWLEHRSRVQAFPSVVHLSWAIAGALDCLRTGKVQQARARLNIALLQADQMSIDRGSWVLAQELSLELPPPMSSFRKHDTPMTSGDPVYSRILGPRWAEIALNRLREEADFLDRRQKLSQRQPQLPKDPPPQETTETPEKPPRRPPRKPPQ